jgi:TPR repeat protein
VKKSKMPDELKNRCHQCRKPIPTTNKGNIEQLREWVGKGELWAQRIMAGWYRDGQFGLKQSYVMARMLYEKAVAQGDPIAMYSLGLLYHKGQGVAQSFEQAFELWTMAAEQGDVEAMYNVGLLYIHGKGVDQSHESARAWWTKAADEGNVNATFRLARLYEDGKKSGTIVPKSN